MKLFLLSTSFPKNERDTAGKWILELADELSKYGIESLALVPHEKYLKVKEQIRSVETYRFKYAPDNFEIVGYGGALPHEKNIRLSKVAEIFHYMVNSILFLSLLFFMFVSGLSMCRSKRPDLLMAHWIFPSGLVGLIIAKLLKLPLVLKVYGKDLVAMKNMHLSFLARFILNGYPMIIANSDYSKEIAKSFNLKDNSKIITIPEGIHSPPEIHLVDVENLKKELGIENQRIIFSIHRLVPLKGTEYSIKAIKEVSNGFSDFVYIVGGAGPLSDDLKKLVNDLGISDKIIFTGFIPNDMLPIYYYISDICLVSSITDKKGYAEGLGLPVVEAMSFGKPVIAFNAGGPKHTVVDGINGYLVDEKDYVGMSEKILQILRNDNLKKELGFGGKRLYMENYTWTHIAKVYYDLINE